MKATRRAILAVPLLAAPALAQPWRPERPVEIVVGFVAGGATDLDARLLARFLEPRLGVPVVVQNRPGAGGEVALAAVARSRPDGHVIGTTNMPGLLTIPIERQAQFKLDDFAPVANVVTDPSAISVPVASPVRDFEGLLAQARREREAVSFGTPGIGTDDHLLMFLLQREAGVRFNHVGFAGDPQIRTAMMAGQIQASGLNLGYLLANPEGVRLLAQAGPRRSRFAPDLPTLREKGLAVEMASERGLVMPAATPAPALARIRDAVAETMADPEFARAVEQRFCEVRNEVGAPWFARLREEERGWRRFWSETPWRQG